MWHWKIVETALALHLHLHGWMHVYRILEQSLSVLIWVI
jgi:hypothetical protein